MYYPYFVSYMVAGFVIGLVLLVWSLKTGQFRDQQRARYLPLQGEPPAPPVKATRASRIEVYALFGLAFMGLLMTAAVLTFAVLRAP